MIAQGPATIVPFAGALVLVAGVGCDGRKNEVQSTGVSLPTEAAAPPVAEAPPMPQPMIWFEPSDRMTSTGATIPKVGLVIHGLEVEKSSCEELAARVSLRTWPELDPVASTTTIQMGASGEGRAYVHLNPASTLSDRWYVIRIDSLPPGMRLAPYPLLAPMPDKSTGARFRPGSAPLLRALKVCFKDDDHYKVQLDFSENVGVGGALTDVLSVSHDDGPCLLLPVQDVESSQLLEYACSNTTAKSSLLLKVGSGLKSATGQPLTDEGGALEFERRINLAEMVDVGGECVAHAL